MRFGLGRAPRSFTARVACASLALVAAGTLAAPACIPDFATRDAILGPDAHGGGGAGAGGAGGEGGTANGGGPPSCSDGVQNGDETDVDCGGGCPRCWLGQRCAETSDCFLFDEGSGGATPEVTVSCDEQGVCAPPPRGHWIKRSPPTTPGALGGLSLAYHELDGRVVLEGGKNSSGDYADYVWSWNGNEWLPYSTYFDHPSVEHGTLVYEPFAQRLLQFGGSNSTAVATNGLEEFDGFAYRSRGAANPPPVRRFHGAAFDVERRKLVVYGGWNASNALLGDTWEYDYETNAWTEMQPTNPPRPAHENQLVWDAARKRIFMFGGEPELDHTYQWDGVDWLELFPENAPSPRFPSGLAYNTRRQRVILFGGFFNVDYYTDTWEWNGSDWQRTAAEGPQGRLNAGMAYDEKRGRVVLYGGVRTSQLGDTWEYHATGNGCTDDGQCDTGQCVDGICCSVDACDTCYACNADPAHVGQCARVLEGRPDPRSGCTCDGQGACE
jgi:hypothetical protein